MCMLYLKKISSQQKTAHWGSLNHLNLWLNIIGQVLGAMSQVSPECARLWQVASPLHLPVKVSKGQPGSGTSCPRQGRMEVRNHRREIMAGGIWGSTMMSYDVIWCIWSCEQHTDGWSCKDPAMKWTYWSYLKLLNWSAMNGCIRLCYCAFGCRCNIPLVLGNEWKRWLSRMSCAKMTKQLALSHHPAVWPSKEKDPENWERSTAPAWINLVLLAALQLACWTGSSHHGPSPGRRYPASCHWPERRNAMAIQWSIDLAIAAVQTAVSHEM